MKKRNGKILSLDREEGCASEGGRGLKSAMDRALEKYFQKTGLNKHGYEGDQPGFAFGKRCGTTKQEVV